MAVPDGIIVALPAVGEDGRTAGRDAVLAVNSPGPLRCLLELTMIVTQGNWYFCCCALEACRLVGFEASRKFPGSQLHGMQAQVRPTKNKPMVYLQLLD